MASHNVSSSIISILASFSNGLDVFRRLREKREQSRRKAYRRKKQQQQLDDDDAELRLSRSLRQGPADITREYQQSLYSVGQAFETGDALAQTSLADVLLRLNSGLVGIITAFLQPSHDKTKTSQRLDYHSLTSLSERSRIETCRVLRQLLHRMTIPRALVLPSRKDKQRRPKPTRVRGPMLAQVYLADSKKPPQIAMVRPGARRKKSSSSSLSKADLTDSSTATTPPPQYSRLALPQIPDAQEIPPRLKQKHSASTSRLATASTPHLPPPPAARPQHIPAQSTTALPLRNKPRPPSRYSIASAQTQLGEIPLHLWAQPYDFDAASVMNREAMENGWPITGGHVPQKKRGWGFGRLFGRPRSN